MANKEHLNILKQGVKPWNAWRTDHPRIRPDLSRANLSGVDLSGANLFLKVDLNGADLGGADLSGANLLRASLKWANLSGANLSGVDLIWANLEETNLVHANLNWANLSGANLSSSDLNEVNLSGANLLRANLSGANLKWANLSGANLANCVMRYTLLVDLDLSEVHGLESVEHRGPSEITISTIYRSRGKIPEIFLRGCGVPEPFIINTTSLVAAMEPIQFYSCFISYSSKDQAFADRLYADLQAKGVRCWLATEDLKIGDKFRQRIDEAIRFYDKLLVVLSASSVNSTWVESEVETAFEKERTSKGDRLVLFPIRLDDAVMKTNEAWAGEIRRQRHIGDFSAWHDHNSYRQAFERLLRDLKGEKAQGVNAIWANE